jgi:hypothetical protein
MVRSSPGQYSSTRNHWDTFLKNSSAMISQIPKFAATILLFVHLLTMKLKVPYPLSLNLRKGTLFFPLNIPLAYDVHNRRRVLKDSWRILQYDIESEDDIYRKLHAGQVPNIPSCLSVGDVDNDVNHESRAYASNSGSSL